MVTVDDRVWQKMIKDLLTSEQVKTQAGFFDGITPEAYNGKSEADIMAINEFGAPLIHNGGRIVPRRAIGKISRQKRKVLARAAAIQGSRIIRGQKINLDIAGSIMQKGISDNINSPTGMRRNMASTARRKGFNNPLTETGHLGSSVTKRTIRNGR